MVNLINLCIPCEDGKDGEDEMQSFSVSKMWLNHCGLKKRGAMEDVGCVLDEGRMGRMGRFTYKISIYRTCVLIIVV